MFYYTFHYTPTVRGQLECNFSILARGKAVLQGGEDPWDALSCRSFFAKEPLTLGLCCVHNDKAVLIDDDISKSEKSEI